MRASWHISTVRALRVALLAVLLPGTLPCCSLDDSRDLCCRYRAAMRYTYLPYGTEAFTEYIGTLRHFLFDGEGNYLGELPPGDDLQYQPIDLPEGAYTMVTLGNAADATTTNHHTEPHIADFALTHTPVVDGHHADELYWGVRHFAIDAGGLLTERNKAHPTQAISSMVTPMNNIHCHINVRVEWENVPDYIGDYTMELDGVPKSYSLNPSRATDAESFIVPQADSLGVHRITVPMQGLELDGTFTTLRLSDDAIPILRLRYGNIPIGPDIDLSKAFRSWGWHPSEVHVQKYSLAIKLYSNGSAVLSPGFETTIDDWIDGGYF